MPRLAASAYAYDAMQVRIPRSALTRRELTYAKLLLRVYPRRGAWNAFDGKLLQCGSVIEERDLWPTPDYPETPLLLESAGKNRKYLNQRNPDNIHILWRYDAAQNEWVELVRCLTQGADWLEYMRGAAQHELARSAPPPDGLQASKVGGRVLGVLDEELEKLNDGDRHLVMAFVFQEFASRAAEY